MMKSPVRLTCLAILLMSVAACKSGGDDGGGSTGGGGQSGGGQTDSAGLTILERNGVTAERIVALARNNPQANADAIAAVEAAAEYARNPAMVAANLANKIALGLTGEGVDVAVVDSGIDWSNSNLEGVERGGDVIALSNGQPGDAETAGLLRHGTAVAQIIAGTPGNGDISRGIAPGARLHNLAFVAEKSEETEYFDEFRLGRIMDYVADNRIDLVNMSFSLGYDQSQYTTLSAIQRFLSPTLQAKIERAVDAGSIFVIATGNDGLAETNNALIGLGQVSGLMDGQIIAVTALNQDGTALADFANACGTAMNYCISAVGVRIPVLNADGVAVGFSGTSAATPVVTGSMALIMEQFPELGRAETVELVFATADDLGDAGIDAVFGRGALNMNRALAPVGELVIATGETTADTVSIAESLVMANGSTAGIADALRGASVTLIDDYDRGFEVSADNFVLIRDEPTSPIREFVLDVGIDGLARLRADGDGGILYSGQRVSVGYIGPEAVFARDSAILDQGYTPAYALDEAGVLGLRTGSSDILLAVADDGDDVLVQIGRDFRMGKTDMRAEFGLMHEKQGLLGGELRAGNSDTAWISLYAERELSGGFGIFGDVTAGKTRLRDGEFILQEADLRSGSARVGISAPIGRGKGAISLGTPLVADSGSIFSDIPVDREGSVDGGTSDGVERARFESRIGSGRPVDLGISWTSPLGAHSDITLKAARRLDDRNGIDRDDDWVALQIRARF